MNSQAPDKSYSTHSPEGPWDTIVIGSGMGGMTAAALLSKLGQRVLVLEQHYVPGGFTHTFKRKKWVWDVGVHAVGEVDPRAAIGRVLQNLTRGELQWASLGEVYDEFHFPDLRIDFPNDHRRFEANLIESFPEEKDAISLYLKRCREVARVMKPYYLSRVLPPALAGLGESVLAREAHQLLGLKTQDVLDQITQNKRLQTVLTAQWGYYGVPPARSSFAIHALVARHFWHGGYYPVGGSASIARALLGTVAAAGGWTRISAGVEEILITGNKVRGVRLESGEEILAPRVISAVGALPTVQRLLPKSYPSESWTRDIEKLKPTPCHVCLYLGFKGDIRAAGASAANKWFYETWASDAAQWNVQNVEEEAPVLYCSFPSLKDPHHDPGPEVLHTGEVVTFVPWEVFAPWRDARWKKRGAEYDALKDQISQRILRQFLGHMPGLKDMIEWVELSTPVSTDHFTRSANGAIYGLEPTPERYQTRSLRPTTPIKGLYLSGADMASVGVMGAMVGGLLTAAAVEPWKAMNYLRNVSRG